MTDQDPQRLGAIDVGTNSVRLIVAEVGPGNTYRIIDEERENTRLGAGVVDTGRLADEPLRRTIDTVVRMQAIAAGLGVMELRAVATSAVREAENGANLLEEVRERSGLTIQTITSDEEAQLAFVSASQNFDLGDRSFAAIDIGGGSVEVILAAGSVIEEVHSLKLGAVRVYERFFDHDPLHPGEWRRIRKRLDRRIKKVVRRLPFEPELVVGSGGTFTALAHLAQHARERRVDNVHGYVMSHIEITRLVKQLRRMTVSQRRRLPGLNPARADIIVAGGAVIQRFIQYLGARSILVNERGIRDGLLLSMIAERSGEELGPADAAARLDGVRRFAQKCFWNESHCEHIAMLSLQIFDAMREPWNLAPEGRDILRAAALLHDVGYLISHAKHHKHSYHLIAHSNLPGFRAEELDLIANVARYHRRAAPKRSHEPFQRLRPERRELVRQCSAILRIGLGLDRTHSQIVTGVTAETENGVVRFGLTAEADPHVEMWDAKRRATLFERVFGVRTAFTWAGEQSGTG